MNRRKFFLGVLAGSAPFSFPMGAHGQAFMRALAGAAGMTQIDVTSLTAFGDLTSNGGLAAAHDGITSKVAANCAAKAATADGYFGIDFGAGGPPATIARIILYPSSDQGFTNQANRELLGIYSNTSMPANSTDGTARYSDSSIVADSTTPVEITGLSITDRYVWMRYRPQGNGAIYFAEMEFYKA